MSKATALAFVEARLQGLPQGLRAHVERVRVLARELAASLGADQDKVDLAAAAHDLARAMDAEALLAQAARLHITPEAVESGSPVLLHGPVAAETLRQELGITDPEVLEAVRWHTTALPGLGLVGQVVFLADKLEPSKLANRPALESARRLAAKNPDQAIAAYLTDELARLLRQNALVHPASVEARNYFLSRPSSR